MGFRFRKSIKAAPGARVNLSKSGISASLGKPGATVNIGKAGVRGAVGVPGTGLSYSKTLAAAKPRPLAPRDTKAMIRSASGKILTWVGAIVLTWAILWLVF